MIDPLSGNSTSSQNSFPLGEEKTITENSSDKEVSSYSPRVWDRIDSYLNLGSSGGLSMSGLSCSEQEQYRKILAKLIKAGVVGYNYYYIDGRVEKHFIECSIGNERLSRAKILLNYETGNFDRMA